MNTLPILPKVQTWLRLRLQSRRWRVACGVGILLVALLIAGLLIVRQRQLATQASASASLCAPTTNAPSVIVGMAPPGVTLPITIPAGEPRVVATVNGAQIYAEGLELRVEGILANHQQTLQQLQQPSGTTPGSLPPNLLATLQETPNQVRHDALTQMIQECLLLQEGNRLGLTASLPAAQAMARQQLQLIRSIPESTPARVRFEAYLRANHLNDQTYVTDPRILHGYIESLTIAAVRQHIQKGLPPGESLTAGVNAYVRLLWQTGNVRVYLPTQLGW